MPISYGIIDASSSSELACVFLSDSGSFDINFKGKRYAMEEMTIQEGSMG